MIGAGHIQILEEDKAIIDFAGSYFKEHRIGIWERRNRVGFYTDSLICGIIKNLML